MNYKPHLNLVIILISILSVQTSYAQWKKVSGNNKFDGDFKHAYISGKGGSYPYNKPVLHITQHNEEDLNIYIDNIGYTGCNNPNLLFAFDQDDDILKFNANSNLNNDATFITSTTQELSDLTELLKNKKVVYIRYRDSCGKEDYEFSLSNSTNAIEFVIGDYFKTKNQQRQQSIIASRKLDSINKFSELQNNKKQRKLDSIVSINQSLELNEKSLKFEKQLMADFNDSKMITVADFKVQETKRAKYCKRTEDGVTYRNREISFYTSDRYKIYNRIHEGCVMMDILDSRGRKDKTIFISNTELLKLSNDYRLKVISKNWIDLINTEK